MKRIIILFLTTALLFESGATLLFAAENKKSPKEVQKEVEGLEKEYKDLEKEFKDNAKKWADQLKEETKRAFQCHDPEVDGLNEALKSLEERLADLKEKKESLEKAIQESIVELNDEILYLATKIDYLNKTMHKDAKKEVDRDFRSNDPNFMNKKRSEGVGRGETSDEKKKQLYMALIASKEGERTSEEKNAKSIPNAASALPDPSFANEYKNLLVWEKNLEVHRERLEQSEKNWEDDKKRQDEALTTGDPEKINEANERLRKREEEIDDIYDDVKEAEKRVSSARQDCEDAARGGGTKQRALWYRSIALEYEICTYKKMVKEITKKQLEELLKKLGPLNQKIARLQDTLSKLIAALNNLITYAEQKKKPENERDKEKFEKAKKELDKFLKRYRPPGAPFYAPGADRPWSIVITGIYAFPSMATKNDYIAWINEGFDGNIDELNTTVGGSAGVFYRIDGTFGVGACYEYLHSGTDGTLANPAPPPARLDHSQSILSHGVLAVGTVDLPLDIRGLDIQGILGVGMYFANYEESENGFVVKGSGSSFGFKAGIGVNYWFTPRFGLRTEAVYRGVSVDRFEDSGGNTLEFVPGYGGDVQADFNGFGLSAGVSCTL